MSAFFRFALILMSTVAAIGFGFASYSQDTNSTVESDGEAVSTAQVTGNTTGRANSTPDGNAVEPDAPLEEEAPTELAEAPGPDDTPPSATVEAAVGDAGIAADPVETSDAHATGTEADTAINDTTQTTPDQAVNPVVVVDGTQNPDDAPGVLQVCLAEKSALTIALANLSAPSSVTAQSCDGYVADAMQPIQTAMANCEEDRVQMRSSNIRLNETVKKLEEQLATCGPSGEGPPEVAELKRQVELLTGELTVLQDELTATDRLLAEAEAKIAEREERLRQFNISLEPAFSYLGNNIRGSFADAETAPTLRAEFPRLSKDKCGEALDWMLSQSGSLLPLRNAIWVYDSNRVQICYRDRDGTPAFLDPQDKDTAHIVIYK